MVYALPAFFLSYWTYQSSLGYILWLKALEKALKWTLCNIIMPKNDFSDSKEPKKITVNTF